MPFTPTNVVNGSTAVNATWGNFVQTQYAEATNSFQPNLFSAAGYVQSGLYASKDAVTATKLNVTAGTAAIPQADSTLRERAIAASSQTTSVINTTYYLFLNNDGTWTWSTTSTPPANSLAVAQVTTDASGNILTVSDVRNKQVTLLPGLVGSDLALPNLTGLNMDSPQPGLYAGTLLGTGTTLGITGLIYGDAGTAYQFNSGGSVSCPVTGLPTIAFTMEIWFKIAAIPTVNRILMCMGNLTTNQGVYALIDSTGKLNVSSVNITPIVSSSAVSLNVAHVVHITWNNTTLQAFLDGTSIGSITPALSMTYTGTNPGYFLAQYFDASQPWVGVLGEAAIYNFAMTTARITAHYQAGVGITSTATYAATVFADTPLRYYRLGDTSGRGVAEQATAANNPVIAKDGGIAPTYVASVSGQPSVGALGVPVIVAQALQVAYTATTLTNILTYTPPVSGLYRATLFVVINGVSGATITADVTFNDGRGRTGSNVFSAYQTGTTVVGLLGATYTPLFDIEPLPQTFYASSAGNIVLRYQNSTGTPNDFVSAIIERLA